MIRKWILGKLFGVPEKHEAATLGCEMPKAGDVWFRSVYDESPWKKETTYEVNVIAVKSGWVRYYMNELFPDERMKIDMFTVIYKNKN